MGDFSFTSDKFVDYVVYDSTGTAMVSGSDDNAVIQNTDTSIYFTYKPSTDGVEIVFTDELWDVVHDNIYDLNDPAIDEGWGDLVTMSADGNVMAINSKTSVNGDYTTVYELSGGEWVIREYLFAPTFAGWASITLDTNGTGLHFLGSDVGSLRKIDSWLWDGSNYNKTGASATTTYFGRGSVSADGNVLAYAADTMAVTTLYIYDWSSTIFALRGSTGSLVAALSDAALNNDGSICVVGQKGVDTNTGKCLVGTLSGVTFTTTDTLTASDRTVNDEFGYSVSMTPDGDVIAVGAPGWAESSEIGKVYIFRKILGVWTETEQIRSRTPHSDHRFGERVSISSNNRIVIGSPGASDGFAGQGKVDVFYYQ